MSFQFSARGKDRIYRKLFRKKADCVIGFRRDGIKNTVSIKFLWFNIFFNIEQILNSTSIAKDEDQDLKSSLKRKMIGRF